MSTGGFIGNLEDAFTPPAAGGCCGEPATATPEQAQENAATCCGSQDAATEAAEAGCCGQAPTTSSGCCG